MNNCIEDIKKSSIRKEKISLLTYPFSDPSPIPEFGRLYPYNRFDGYTAKGTEQAWEMIVMENDFIKLWINPSVGGKIWGAIEKSTGKEFIYFNHVAKFRDVAMRGPWTSGGMEINMGIIGHSPSCSSPVDYHMQQNDDG
ncbi:MAG: Tetratricopeptide domain protein, partial [Mucilaginibacter sp.]|nr:Tetratricopeptide domain protein [Mucilaginibacter sp.]